MKLVKIYRIAFSLLFIGVLTDLIAQENEKVFYDMKRIKMDNPWSESMNGSGLTFKQTDDFSIVEVDFKYGNGSYKNFFAPTSFNKTNLMTESFRRINKVYFYGRFSFDYHNRLRMGWTNVIDPYRSSIFLADSTPGRQVLETYSLIGLVGYEINNKWRIGGKIDYTNASNAKKKDARNQNTYMYLKLYPGVMYSVNHLNIGLNFIYEKETEKINITLKGENKEHEIFTIEGLWFYLSDRFSTGEVKRDIEDEVLGGGIQLEFYTDKLRFFNQFSMTERNQEIFSNDSFKPRAGEMKRRQYKYLGNINITTDKFNHYLKLDMDFTSTLGYENLQRQGSLNGFEHYFQYGKKNKSSIEASVIDASYRLIRKSTPYLSSWEAMAGVKGFYIEKTFRLYPAEYKQVLKNVEAYISFNKNFLFENCMLNCGVEGAYKKGGGTMIKMKLEADTELPNVEEYKQRTDMLYQEFQYIASDVFKGGVNVRYTYFLDKETGMNLYAKGNINFQKSLDGYYDGKDRTTLQATIGLSF